MKAMVLEEISPIERKPLRMVDLPTPEPESRQVLVKVSACGVCHTELDEIEGRIPSSGLPMILGHQIVGRVKTLGSEAARFNEGDRVGITWLNWACGKCSFCLEGNENLCERARWTGKDVDGGYAQYTVVSEDFAHPIPERFSAVSQDLAFSAGRGSPINLERTQISPKAEWNCIRWLYEAPERSGNDALPLPRSSSHML